MVTVIGTDENGETIDSQDGVTNTGDFIFGLGGADRIFGLSGNDYIKGGGGTDTIDGGTGTDIASYLDSDEAVSISLGNSFAAVGGTAEGDTLFNVENLIGSRFNDFLQGNSGNNVLKGGGGGDRIDGGSGIDTASYIDSTEGVIISLDNSLNASGGTAEGDFLLNIENLEGSRFNDFLQGNSGGNVLKGGDGADRIDGGSGVDTASYDDSTEGVSIGLDNSVAARGGTAEGDTLFNIENLLGSQWGDTLIGNSGGNLIQGGGGDDYIEGGGGADTLQGGANNDILKGGGGADTLQGGTNIDILKGGGGADVLDGGSGTDTASYLFSDEGVFVSLDENEAFDGEAQGDTFISIENLDGSAHDDGLEGDDGPVGNTLNGNGGDDWLNGGLGADILIGGTGGDTFFFNKVDTGAISTGQADEIRDFNQTDWIEIATDGIEYEFANTDTTPGENEFSIYRSGTGWVVSWNNASDNGVHQILVHGDSAPTQDDIFFV